MKIMAEEFNEEETGEEEIIRNKTQDRITTLSNKVKTASEERDAYALAKEEAEAKALAFEKEKDFYKDFSTIATKPEFAGAGEYQEQIKEKVVAGYTVEDAAISILAKEGKYQPPSQPVERELVAGGSSLNRMPDGSTKPIGEMTREEKRAALIEADSR